MTREELKAILGEAATDEIVNAIMQKHGVSTEKLKKANDKLTADLATAKEENKATTEKITALETVAGDADKFKAELDTLKAQIADDAAKAQAKAERDTLYAEIDKLMPEGREFLNDYAKKGIYADIEAQFAADKTKGLKHYFDALTKDDKGNEIEGVFKSPQSPAKIPPMGNADVNLTDDQRRAATRQAMGLSVNPDGDNK